MIEVNIPEVVAEVEKAFARYERALVSNDIAELDALGVVFGLDLGKIIAGAGLQFGRVFAGPRRRRGAAIRRRRGGRSRRLPPWEERPRLARRRGRRGRRGRRSWRECSW